MHTARLFAPAILRNFCTAADQRPGFKSTDLRQQFEAASKQLQVSNLSDWYSVDPIKLLRTAPPLRAAVRSRFRGSLFAALSVAFPEHNWIVSHTPNLLFHFN